MELCQAHTTYIFMYILIHPLSLHTKNNNFNHFATHKTYMASYFMI